VKSHPRILLVDDDAALRRIALKILSRCGYDVVEARSLSDAIAAVAEQSPDLVITDFVMPDGNGQELARQLRASGWNARVLYMSGYGPEILEQYGIAADDVLGKPFTPQQLLAKLTAWGAQPA